MKIFASIALFALFGSVVEGGGGSCAADECSCQPNTGKCAAASAEQPAGKYCDYVSGSCTQLDVPAADSGTSEPADGETGGHCKVKYESYLRGQKMVEEYTQDPDHSCINSADVCMPHDPTTSTSFEIGTCESQTCHGKQKPGIIPGVDDDDSNEATIRVTICHRTCSATNPWVRITIDDDAWGGPAASGCGHKQHNVSDECRVSDDPNRSPAAKYSEAEGDAIWGVGRRVDYLLKLHGTRATLRSNMGWDSVTCNNGGKCTYSDEEKDYWFYWERACPYVRHGDCCGSLETGACCGDNPYPHVTTGIELKKYACPDAVDCSTVSGITSGCEDEYLGSLALETAQAAAKYCYTVENTGDVEICELDMTDPEISASYNPVINQNNCLPPNSGPVVVPELATEPWHGREQEIACVAGMPMLEGMEPLESCDDAAIEWHEPEEQAVITPAPVTPRPNTPAPTPCPLMDNTGSTVCPSTNIVSLLEEKGPTLPNGGEFIWDITLTDGSEVSFKVDNPFDEVTDIYVEYHKSVGSALGAYDVDCERDLKTPGCDPAAEAITAACIVRGDKKFTVVTVYFVSADSFFDDVVVGDASVPECCEYFANGSGSAEWKTVAYTYEIMCTC